MYDNSNVDMKKEVTLVIREGYPVDVLLHDLLAIPGLIAIEDK